MGYFGVPAWRHTHRLGLSLEGHRININASVIAGQTYDPRADESLAGTGVPEHKEYDIVYGTDLPWGTEVMVGINNIFDKQGGVYSQSSFIGSESLIDQSIYSYAGRTFFARVSQKF